MNWPPYPAYQETDTAWLGRVPAGWSVRRLGYFFRERKTTVSDRDFQPLSVTKDGIVPQLDTAAKTDNGDSRKLVKTGDFVINSRSDRKGSAGLSPLEGSVAVISTVLEPRGLEGRYVHHLLRSQAFQEEYYRFGSGIVADLWSTRYSSMKMITMAAPPQAEQVAIGAFLDCETSKIDALIAKQEQLISTLREDRSATIAHAVTKGLDPEAAMNESGVGWLGQVPAHWSVPQIGMHAAIGNGSTPTRDNLDYWSGGNIPWLNSSHVNREEITEPDQFVTEVAFRECHLPMVRAGSVLVGLTGQGKTRGMASVLLTPSTINQHLAYLTPIGQKVDGRFLQRALSSAYGLLREISDENGSTKGGLTCGDLRKVRIPLPPLAEQIQIVEHLAGQCKKIDALISKAVQMIETLREFRSALITDAVTGKIDVRRAA